MTSRIPCLLLVVALSCVSCTSEILTFKRCNGGFTLVETIPCGKRGSVTIDLTGNLGAGSADGVVDSVSPTESRSTVWAVLADPCQPGEIGYSFTCDGKRYDRSVTISASGVMVDAPVNIQADADGKFSYEIEVRCCREGVDHRISAWSPAPMIVDLNTSKPTLKCEQTERVQISGRLARPRGGYVDVTITGPSGTCTTTTNVLGQD